MKKFIATMALAGLWTGLAAMASAQEAVKAAPAPQPNWTQQALDLRAQMCSKRWELRRLQAQENPPADRMAELQKEIEALRQQWWDLNRQNAPADVVAGGLGLGLGLGPGPGNRRGTGGPAWGQGRGRGQGQQGGQRLRLRDGSCGYGPGWGQGRGGWGRGYGQGTGLCPWGGPRW